MKLNNKKYKWSIRYIDRVGFKKYKVIKRFYPKTVTDTKKLEALLRLLNEGKNMWSNFILKWVPSLKKGYSETSFIKKIDSSLSVDKKGLQIMEKTSNNLINKLNINPNVNIKFVTKDVNNLGNLLISDDKKSFFLKKKLHVIHEESNLFYPNLKDTARVVDNILRTNNHLKYVKLENKHPMLQFKDLHNIVNQQLPKGLNMEMNLTHSIGKVGMNYSKNYLLKEDISKNTIGVLNKVNFSKKNDLAQNFQVNQSEVGDVNIAVYNFINDKNAEDFLLNGSIALKDTGIVMAASSNKKIVQWALNQIKLNKEINMKEVIEYLVKDVDVQGEAYEILYWIREDLKAEDSNEDLELFDDFLNINGWNVDYLNRMGQEEILYITGSSLKPSSSIFDNNNSSVDGNFPMIES